MTVTDVVPNQEPGPQKDGVTATTVIIIAASETKRESAVNLARLTARSRETSTAVVNGDDWRRPYRYRSTKPLIRAR